MELVQRKDYSDGMRMVGPIPEGQTAEESIAHACENMLPGDSWRPTKYAYVIHREPLRGKNQQFPVIVGAYWAW